MIFTDRMMLERFRPTGETDALQQPIRELQAAVPVWCRAWPNREGHRESIEATTGDDGTFRIEGISIGVPWGTDVQEEDLISSLLVEGRQWLIGGGNPVKLRVRALPPHRFYHELQCQIVR